MKVASKYVLLKLRFLIFSLCLALPLVSQTSSKSITLATFAFNDVALEAQERGQNTAPCIAKALVMHLNSKFKERPLFKYWQFQTGVSSEYPYVQVSTLYQKGWNLRFLAHDPHKVTDTSVDEPLFLPGELTQTPSGCEGWKPLLERALDRLIDNRPTEVLKVLQAVPVTNTLTLQQ